MKKAMVTATCILLAAFGLALAGYYATRNAVLETVAITLGITAYHFAMRLLVGLVFNSLYHNRIDGTHRWFQPRRWEPALYRALHVKAWKRHMPTFESENFDIQKHSLPEVIGATCQAELVHESIMVLSFLPVFTIRFFGAAGVMVATSVMAAGIDFIFVMMQRYNRPRLQKLLRHEAGR